jgi:uncharacterized membrane protein
MLPTTLPSASDSSLPSSVLEPPAPVGTTTARPVLHGLAFGFGFVVPTLAVSSALLRALLLKLLLLLLLLLDGLIAQMDNLAQAMGKVLGQNGYG